MNATRNHRSNTAITRLIQFAFALMLVFTSLAASGCGVVDSNEPLETERVLIMEEPALALENVAVQDEAGSNSNASAEGDLGDSSDYDSYGNPVKDGR